MEKVLQILYGLQRLRVFLSLECCSSNSVSFDDEIVLSFTKQGTGRLRSESIYNKHLDEKRYTTSGSYKSPALLETIYEDDVSTDTAN